MSWKELKRARRKVEYYAAWCLAHWKDVKEEVDGELAQWGEDWLSKGDDGGGLRDEEKMFVVQEEGATVYHGVGGNNGSGRCERGTVGPSTVYPTVIGRGREGATDAPFMTPISTR